MLMIMIMMMTLYISLCENVCMAHYLPSKVIKFPTNTKKGQEEYGARKILPRGPDRDPWAEARNRVVHADKRTDGRTVRETDTQTSLTHTHIHKHTSIHTRTYTHIHTHGQRTLTYVCHLCSNLMFPPCIQLHPTERLSCDVEQDFWARKILTE